MSVQLKFRIKIFVNFVNKYQGFRNIPYKIGFKQAFDEAIRMEKPLRVFIMSGTEDDIRSTKNKVHPWALFSQFLF